MKSVERRKAWRMVGHGLKGPSPEKAPQSARREGRGEAARDPSRGVGHRTVRSSRIAAGTIDAHRARNQHEQAGRRTRLHRLADPAYGGRVSQRTPWRCEHLRRAVREDDVPIRLAFRLRRLQAELVRGMAPEPGARHPSMTALLDALTRDPARSRKRLVFALGTVAVVGGSVWLGSRVGELGARSGLAMRSAPAALWLSADSLRSRVLFVPVSSRPR